MRQQIIITVILSIALCIAVSIKLMFFPILSDHTAYYFHSIFWICGVLVVIFLLNILWHFFIGYRPPSNTRPTMGWPNRRKSYRIIYPNYMRPKLIVDTVDSHDKRQLEYPVMDLSQDGLCFIDDGSLGNFHWFTGRIHFLSGNSIQIGGHLLRNQKGQISVQLDQGIGWPTILNEQRQLLSQTKPVKA